MNGVLARHRFKPFSLFVVTLLVACTASPLEWSVFARDFGTDAVLDRSSPGQSGESPVGAQVRSDGLDPKSKGIIVAQSSETEPAVARLDLRLTELERELRESTGRIEQLSHQLRRLEERFEKLSSDIDYRLSQRTEEPGAVPSIAVSPEDVPSSRAATEAANPQMVSGEGPTVLGRLPESQLGSAKGQSATPGSPASVAGPAQTAHALQAGTPREQYAHGFALLRTANYDEAEVAFKQFLSQNPDDPLADNARYWLGETYYARGDYAAAAETFLDGYQKSKTGPKAPDSLLKLGMSLSSLDKKAEACATYDELRRALPDAPESIKSKAAQEQQRLSCK